MKKFLRVLVLMLTFAATVQGTAGAYHTEVGMPAGGGDGGGRPPRG